MEVSQLESLRQASTAMNRTQTQVTSPHSVIRQLPHGAVELMLPALRTIISSIRLFEFHIVPLATQTYFLSQGLLTLMVPTMIMLLTTIYQLLRLSMRIQRVFLYLAGSIMQYISRAAAASRFQKNLEREVYSFFLGPGMMLVQGAFWLGWWSVVGATLSAPWWLLA